MRKHLYVARKGAPVYLAEGYAQRRHRSVDGVARTGEVSPKGTVAHIEDWEGRMAVEAAPTTLRYIRDSDGTIRPMTFAEMVARGYFILGRGPKGVRHI